MSGREVTAAGGTGDSKKRKLGDATTPPPPPQAVAEDEVRGECEEQLARAGEARVDAARAICASKGPNSLDAAAAAAAAAAAKLRACKATIARGRAAAARAKELERLIAADEAVVAAGLAAEAEHASLVVEAQKEQEERLAGRAAQGAVTDDRTAV